MNAYVTDSSRGPELWVETPERAFIRLDDDGVHTPMFTLPADAERVPLEEVDRDVAARQSAWDLICDLPLTATAMGVIRDELDVDSDGTARRPMWT